MRCSKIFLAGLFSLLAACSDQLPQLPQRVLPFPTPAQHDLVVLVSAGPLTYYADDKGATHGIEHDLIEAFAHELGVGVNYLVVPRQEIEPALSAGKAHLAAAWLQPHGDPTHKMTPPILQSSDVLIQHEASLPLDNLDDLARRTVHALAGSRQLLTLRALQKEIPNLEVVEFSNGDMFSLLEALRRRQVELVAIDSMLVRIAAQFVPTVQATLELEAVHPVVWWLGNRPNAELLARASAFVERAQRDGTLARIEDRYFGHVRRLKQADIVAFLGRIESTLPKLRKHFVTAQTITGIDWRLIAAIAYHESQWDPEATSPTGVGGIMMLTEETADRLGVGNRLDARESILAGARYVNILRALQPDEVGEPDRTWLALAAYNIGPGHFNAARTLAKQLGVDPGAWYEMKQMLPLLAQPKYYQRLKSGRARGGEAVLLVENIRSYYEILRRNEAPHVAVSATVEAMVGMGGAAPGLKPGR